MIVKLYMPQFPCHCPLFSQLTLTRLFPLELRSQSYLKRHDLGQYWGSASKPYSPYVFPTPPYNLCVYIYIYTHTLYCPIIRIQSLYPNLLNIPSFCEDRSRRGQHPALSHHGEARASWEDSRPKPYLNPKSM